MTAFAELISSHHIKINLSPVPKSQLLWINRIDLKDSIEEFRTRFSFVIKDTPAFSNIVHDTNVLIAAEVERYGGSGIGGNGGGSRSANFYDAQIKGIGANILVGDGVPDHHGYGGLDIYCAAIEIVLTELLNQIMPLGAIANKGLIFIDQNAGRYDNSDCWAVLLIREIPMRPGHFLHAGSFRPKSSNHWIYRSEESRIKNIYRDIDRKIGTTDFINYLGKFLSASANQFAFSKMARLLHGGLSESNMSMDGRWLDVPLVGFVPSGKNWSQQSDFYTEEMLPLQFISHCLYNFTKYTKKVLNPQPLFNYYLEQLNEYKKLHCTFLLGIDSPQMQSIYDLNEVSKLCELFQNIIISKDKQAIKSYPQLTEKDHLDDIIINIWEEILTSLNKPIHLNRDAANFKIILEKLGIYTPQKIKSFAIQSIKRLLLCRFFYLKNSTFQAKEFFYKVAEVEDKQYLTTSYIQKRIDLIKWIYQINDSGNSILLEIPNISITYKIEEMEFDVVIEKQKFSFDSSNNLRLYIEQSEQLFNHLDFDFSGYIKTIINLLCILEE